MENVNIIKPIFDRALLEAEAEQVSGAGIIVPREAGDRSHVMRVAAVGECAQVRVGDRVIVAKYAGTEVAVGAAKYLLVCEYDILGVVQGG